MYEILDTPELISSNVLNNTLLYDSLSINCDMEFLRANTLAGDDGPAAPVGPVTIEFAPVGPVFPVLPVGPVLPVLPVFPVGPVLALIVPCTFILPCSITFAPVCPILILPF